MNGIFIHILSMSITAGYCIVAVILIRFLLKRQPKVFSYMLWSIVLFRLLCPVSLSSPLSVLPVNPDTILQEKTYLHGESSLSGGETGKTAESGDNIGEGGAAAIEPQGGTASLRSFLTAGAGARIWLCGMLLLAVYGIGTAVRFRIYLKSAVRLSDGLFEMEGKSKPY